MPISQIIFPANRNYHYYKMHYQYVLDSIKAAGISVKIDNTVKEISKTAFEIKIDDQLAAIDFNNFTDILPNHQDYPFYFKFQFSGEIHENIPQMFPFGTISFYDWQQYHSLRKNISYTCQSDIVLNNQRPYANAKERRLFVKKLLTRHLGKNVDFSLTNQLQFWEKINDCLVSVCVPGARNGILDRGQIQYFALGACTISPKIQTMLPYEKRIIPGEHYIQCHEEYGDLVEKIEWCKANREQCREIGRNAQQLFESTSTPQALWSWVEQNVIP